MRKLLSLDKLKCVPDAKSRGLAVSLGTCLSAKSASIQPSLQALDSTYHLLSVDVSYGPS